MGNIRFENVSKQSDLLIITFLERDQNKNINFQNIMPKNINYYSNGNFP